MPRTNTTILDHKKVEELNLQLLNIRGTKTVLAKMYDDINDQIKKILTPLADDMEDTKTFLFPRTKVNVSDTYTVNVPEMREYLMKHNVPVEVVEAAANAATKTGYRFTVGMRQDVIGDGYGGGEGESGE